MTSGTSDEGILCVPDAIPTSERAGHFALATRLLNEVALSRTALDGGYEFRFRSSALPSVAQFVANERLCCPFMDFEIVIAGGADAFVLRMTGPKGAREVLEAELKIEACRALR